MRKGTSQSQFFLLILWFGVLQTIALNLHNKMQRIAIIGGGYAGLATSVQLSRAVKTIHLFDNYPPGYADASSTSAGVMHPMATRGKIIWKGEEGMNLALEMLNSVSSHDKPLYSNKIRLNRLLFTTTDLDLWRDASHKFPNELEFVEASKLVLDSTTALGAVRIKRAVVVDSPAYLKALWAKTAQNCESAMWKQERVESVADLSQQYDAVILACGAGVLKLCAPLQLPAGNKIDTIRLVRGQNAIYEGHKNSNNIGGCDTSQEGYLSGEYVLPAQPTDNHHHHHPDKEEWLVGSTHEHITMQDYEENYSTGDKLPNLAVVQSQIQNRILKLHPKLVDFTPVRAAAGTRVVTQRNALGRHPIVGRLPVSALSNVWVHTGFGSRGLVLHALTAKYLCDAILRNDESTIPECLRVMNSPTKS